MRGETVLVGSTPVDNVLVEPGLSRNAVNIELPVGAIADYTLVLPKSFEGPLYDAKVTVRGTVCDTLVHADHWRPQDVFGEWDGDWDMISVVGHTIGDFTVRVAVMSVSTAIDALGDGTETETEVWTGMVQARRADQRKDNSTEPGTALESDATELWDFVIPWQQGFASLRPQSTRIYRGAVRYDVRSIVNVDEKSEYAMIEAVHHG